MTQKMTSERLIELIEIWGADTGAFPEAEQTAARDLLAASDGAFDAHLEQARAVDALLSDLPDIVPTEALSAALIASAPVMAAPKTKRSLFNWPRLWSFSGAAAALAVGLAAGLSTPASNTSEAPVDEWVETAFGLEIYEGLEDYTQ